jgi:hypothetical protein
MVESIRSRKWALFMLGVMGLYCVWQMIFILVLVSAVCSLLSAL